MKKGDFLIAGIYERSSKIIKVQQHLKHRLTSPEAYKNDLTI